MSSYTQHISKLYSGLLSNCARNATAVEIMGALGFTPDSTVKHEEVSAFLSSLSEGVETKGSAEKATKVAMAYKLFVNKDMRLKKPFEDIAALVYKSSSQLFDSENAPETVAAINEWVDQATCGKIKNIVDENAIEPSTLLILLNTLYFKASWIREFDPFEAMKFTLSDSSEIRISGLFRRAVEVEIADHPKLNCRGCRLNFQDNKYSLFILLPTAANGLEQLLRDVVQVPEKLMEALQNGYQTRTVDFRMPSLKTTTTIDLVELLSKCGITSLFAKSADLSELTETPAFVASMVQKTVFEVNEYGVEAAAVTAMRMELLSALLNTEEFEVDRPYVMGIQERVTRNPIFIGHVNNPNAC